MSHSSTLPPIKAVLVESWGIFQQKIGKLLLITTSTLIVQILLGLLFISTGIGVLLGFGNINFTQAGTSPFAQTPGWVVGALGVLGIAFFISQISVTLIGFISSFLSLENDAEDLQTIVKRSLPRVVPLVATQFLASLLIFGSLFLFFIPGLVASFFFLFVTHIVIYEKKSLSAALQYSSTLVSHNFGNLFIKLLLPFIAHQFIQAIVFSLMKQNPAGAILLQVPLFLVNMIYAYFMMIYYVVLYRHAKTTVKDTQTTVLRWFTILSIIGYLVFSLFIFGIVRAVKSPSGQQFIQKIMEASKETENNGMAQAPVENYSLSPTEAAKLGTDTFSLINNKRIALGYKPLKSNDKLCAYTKRRMDLFAESGSYDEGQGLYADLKNPAVSSLYFTNNSFIREYIHETSNKGVTSDEIVNYWMNTANSENDSQGLLEKSLDQACLLSNTQIMMMVTSGPSNGK